MILDSWESRYEHALSRCEAAEQRRVQADAEWIDAGRPLLDVLPNKIARAHQLLTVLRDLEAHCDKLRKSAIAAQAGRPGSRAGRPIGSGSAPDRAPSRRSRLKAVDGGR